MRESMWAARKDIFQRIAMVTVLVVIAFGGAWLGTKGSPDFRGILVGALGAVTLLWIIDPALQLLMNGNDEESEEVTKDGDVA
jgi:hypothetical protein